MTQVFYRGALTCLFGAVLVMTMSTADARWYKWVDESGNISYQDRPPPANYDESTQVLNCLLYTSPSPRDGLLSRMPSSA